MFHQLTRTHILLFLGTVLTTLMTGTWLKGINPFTNPEKIYHGISFSFSLLFILLTHEFGHYFASRKHHTPATLPYFIPAPPLPFSIGTFGAFIKMKPPILYRRSLIDIGASGPLAGFVAAMIAVAIGLRYSEVKTIEDSYSGFSLGGSLIFNSITKVFLSFDADYQIVILHPIAFAGWIGFFVTSINLLPIGQLDGGHILYALSKKGHKLISVMLIPILLFFGFFSEMFGWAGWRGWGIWAFLMLILGIKHPPVVYPEESLETKRKFIGVLSFVVFILTFMPEPFKFN